VRRRESVHAIDREFDAADTEAVAVLQRRAFGALAVHESAVGAVEIDHLELGGAGRETAVQPRDQRGIDDEVGALLHAIATPALSGPVNVVAPHPVTNAEFTQALARAVHRPAVLPVPRLALNAVLGRELAENLFVSQRVAPAKLESSGYRFAHPTIDDALRAVV